MVTIRGFVKTTMIDYPGKMASEAFLGGCNMRCPFCHNIELVKGPDGLESISEEEVISFLKKRRKWVDGLVISGGEPTIHRDLPGFIRKAKDEGFLVKLDTNGTNPGMVGNLIKEGLLDCIAMDIKSSPGGYEKACGGKVDMKAIRRSVSLIMNSGLDYEFRTTLVPGIHSSEDVKEIGKWLKGAKKYFIQQFKSGETLDPKLKGKPTFSGKELREMADSVSDCFDVVEVRD
jgi:pyruvate formate lyase activating enzyme